MKKKFFAEVEGGWSSLITGCITTNKFTLEIEYFRTNTGNWHVLLFGTLFVSMNG